MVADVLDPGSRAIDAPRLEAGDYGFKVKVAAEATPPANDEDAARLVVAVVAERDAHR